MNSAWLPPVLVFAAAALAVLTAHSLIRDVLPNDARHLRRRLARAAQGASGPAPSANLFKDLNTVAAQPFDDQEQRAATWRESLLLVVAQSGMATTPRRVLRNAILLGLVLAAVSWLVTGTWLAGIVGGVLGGSLPLGLVWMRRTRRLERLRAQLADAFALMARVIRAGQTPSQAMRLVSEEFGDPIGQEFAFCQDQQKLGLPVDTALRDLVRRTGILEIKMFVVAVLVHRDSGGNLSELLDRLAAVIRDRAQVRGLIRSLTAEGRLQGGVLLALPLALLGILLLMQPTVFGVLFDYPWLLAGASVSELVGALWIRHIVDFDL